MQSEQQTHEAREKVRLAEGDTASPYLYGSAGLWSLVGFGLNEDAMSATGALVVVALAAAQYWIRKDCLGKARRLDETERVERAERRKRLGIE